jgi:hypothetical protein
MEEHRKEDQFEEKLNARNAHNPVIWLVILGVLIVAVATMGGAYAYQQYTTISSLTVENQSLHSTMDQLRGQVGTLTARVEQLAAAPPSSPTGATGASAKNSTQSAAAARLTAVDGRVKRLQAQVDQQKKDLAEEQSQLALATSDLNGKLGSTRDELNGSIARSHDELVSLEKRGERNFFEFDLSKSKGFKREGPIQISLRKADPKHQSFDVMMLMNDHELSKKKVNLYEPIWLHDADQPQPIQLVVNKIDKDDVHGYVSAPKYRESELASNNPTSDFGPSSKPSVPSPVASSIPTIKPTPPKTQGSDQPE